MNKGIELKELSQYVNYYSNIIKYKAKLKLSDNNVWDNLKREIPMSNLM